MCREHVVDVRDNYRRFLDAGGDVAVITMGSVEQTSEFRERNRLPFVCLADPKRIAYQAYGVPRGTTLQVAGPAVWAGGLRATLRAGVGKPVGDVLQLHGSFIVDVHGIIRVTYIPKHSADQPTNDELIAQLQNIARGNIVGRDEHR
ncbi:MAG: redoxin domain-containing protein [Planctomycetaceae bacterium]|nr:redoxin domain-containing protein [Planctomycetales bacterium]MCB9923506.1 redoxin domain-containing protein [Planctomycetaceae bacterium]